MELSWSRIGMTAVVLALAFAGGASAIEDCNFNGIDDAVEIAEGWSLDCNENGIPDECEPTFEDCDANGLDDTCQAAAKGLLACYFENRDLSGAARLRLDPNVDFDFDADPPFPGSYPTNDFSARWTGSVTTTVGGSYAFGLDHDDGVRLWVDGLLVVDHWQSGSGFHAGTIALTGNAQHHLRLEYFEASGEAKVSLQWKIPGAPDFVPIPEAALRPTYDPNGNAIPEVCEYPDCNGNGLPDFEDIANGYSTDCDADEIPDECQPCEDCDGNGLLEVCEAAYLEGLVAQYWTSDDPGDFTERKVVQVDPNIDFDWGNGAPLPELPADDFAIRWTGTITTPDVSGTYLFHPQSDDGVRLWVDDQLLVDEWHPASGSEYTAPITLAANTSYVLRLDYYEAGGDARIFLRWTVPGEAKVIVPSTALGPMADADGNGFPDVCDATDCNGNGISDFLDVSTGTSPDCNANCIPDECDIVPPDPLAYWRFEETTGPVLDSGPNQLDGTATNASRVTDVPVDPVPQIEESNARSLELGGNGYVTVPDTGGLLTMGERSFTIEAWVKLDHLSDTSSAEERQYLCQKKDTSAGDTALDYAFLVQRGLISPAVGHGKTTGITGRELMLVFGDGTRFWGVTSHFEIDDLGWNHVSVAFDAEADRVRFVLGDESEWISIADEGHTTNAGPLLVGAHTNASGGYGMFLRGTIDELRIRDGVVPESQLLPRPSLFDCNGNGIPDDCDLAAGTSDDCNRNGIPDECELALGTSFDCNANGVLDECDILYGTSLDCNGNGVPDECDLAEGTSEDCNGNGIPDECDLAEGTSLDCNGNGVPDECDIASGTSGDCQPDGIPDECQLDVVYEGYVLDDGFNEYGVRGAGSYMAWLNHFTVADDAETISAIVVSYSFVPVGKTMDLYLWSDPDGDGDPVDAQVLAHAVDPVEVVGGGTFTRVDLPDTWVGPNGTSFFVGLICSTTSDEYPGALDSTPPSYLEESWIVGSDVPIDPNDLGANAIEFVPIEDAIPFPGNWIVRAEAVIPVGDCNGNGVPDECDLAEGTSLDLDENGIPDECEDCNGNGIPDGCDLTCDGPCGTAFPGDCAGSVDCNGNWIPDECELGANDCNGNGVPDDCDIAEGTSEDCNKNDVPDECDIASGTSTDLDGNGIPDECEDCNGNGIPDLLDIASGTSVDCQPDGVPDECQFGEPVLRGYVLDDGSQEAILGIGAPGDLAWLNQFTVRNGAEYLRSVEMSYGDTPDNIAVTIYVWSDPDQDGDPTDAEVVAAVETVTVTPPEIGFHSVEFPDVYVGEPGSSFFVGSILHDPAGFFHPISLDTTAPVPGRGWVAISLDPVPLDPNDLSNSDLFGRIENVWGPANFRVRAKGYNGLLPFDCNGNGIPDDCDIIRPDNPRGGTSYDRNRNGVPDECETGVLSLPSGPGR
jgi:hypothetical protein